VFIGDGRASLSGPAEIDYSGDSGATWSVAKGLPDSQSVEAIAYAPDAGRAYAYLYGGDLYASADDGQTWSSVSTALRSSS